MANTQYIFSVRDSTISTGDNRKTGLTPKWVFMQTLAGITIGSGSYPVIAEASGGQYKFGWDADNNSEITAQIDAGSGLVNGTDRFIDILCGITPSIIIASGLYNVSISPPSGQAQNLQQALVATHRRFYKKVTLDSSNNLITYQDDGETPITIQAIADNGTTRISNSA